MSRSTRLRLLAPVAVVALLLGLAACGDDDKTDKTATPPTDLVLKVLKDGTGDVVQKGDSVTVDYTGTIWGGKVFDESYTSAPRTFATNKVVPGFGAALVGQKVGTQLVVSIPSALGYGPSGNTGAGISGTDTIVFVVDIKDTKRPAPLKCTTKPGAASNAVKVTGAAGKAPKLTFAKPLKTTSLQRTVVKAGTGPATVTGETVAVAVSVFNGRTGKQIDQTSSGSLLMGDEQIPAYLSAGVYCAKIGSRSVTTVKAKDLFGTTGDAANDIKPGDTLVLVTDVIEKVADQAPVTPKDWTNPPTVVFNGRELPTLTLPKA